MTPEIEIKRVTSLEEIAPIVELCMEADVDDLFFSPADFVRWAPEAVANPNVMIAVLWHKQPESASGGRPESASGGREAAGFFIAFGPWALEKTVFVYQGFILPEWRQGAVLQKGLTFVRDWGIAQGATSLSFQTTRINAWWILLRSLAKRLSYRMVAEV